jgi:hypothetical protein
VLLDGVRFWYQERVGGGRPPRGREDFLDIVGWLLVCLWGFPVEL